LTSPEWLTAEQIDETYSSLLPSRKSEITADEIAELTAVFGENGEMAAERLSYMRPGWSRALQPALPQGSALFPRHGWSRR
jgi:hypothetical protein